MASAPKSSGAARGKAEAGRTALSPTSPLGIGLIGSALLSAVLVFFGVVEFRDDAPIPFWVALGGAGILGLLLSWSAWHRSRAAWAFLLAMHGTGFVVFFFGSPKLRDAFDVSLALGFVPALAFGLVTVLLTMGADEY